MALYQQVKLTGDNKSMKEFAMGLYKLTNKVDFGHAYSIDQDGRHENQES